MMSMDAHSLNPWRSRLAKLPKSPHLKIIFFEVDGVLIDRHTGRLIDQEKLLFTISQLWQMGHILAIASETSPFDTQKTQQIGQVVENIQRQTGVPIFLDKSCSYDHQHDDALLEASVFDNDPNHPNHLAKNTTIFLSLAKLGLYCQPHAYQNGLLVSPTHRLPNEPMPLYHQREAIMSQQVVLVDHDASSLRDAKILGWHTIHAKTTPSPTSSHGHIEGNDAYLLQLMHQYTHIQEQSLAWLNQNSPIKRPDANTQTSVNWAHYLYYLQHFYPQYCTKDPQKTSQHIKRQLIKRCSSKTERQAHQQRSTLTIIIVAGVVVACIGGGMTWGGFGSAVGLVTAGVGVKVIVAKLSMYFGIGSAGGSLAVVLKKFRAWLNRMRYQRSFAKWMKSQQMVNAAIHCELQALRAEARLKANCQRTSMVDHITNALRHQPSPLQAVTQHADADDGQGGSTLNPI